MLPTGVKIEFQVFEGKQDLDKNLERRVKAWKGSKSLFLIVRDKDSADCIKLKKELHDRLVQTSKIDKCCIRIACHELESFYLGDLNAVATGLELKNIAKLQEKKKYRDPDLLANASEELKKITHNQYQKVSGSRKIAPFLNLEGVNKSHSFNVLLSGIRTLIDNFQED